MPSQQWRPLLAAVVLALFWMAHPAQAKCLSPSAESGATATTVYRCPEQDPATAKQPIIVNPEKTTVVERGSSNEPWFEPKPLDKKAEPVLAPANKPVVADKPTIKPVDEDKPVIKPAKAKKKKTVVRTKLASKKQLKVKAAKVSPAKSKAVKKAPAPKIVSAKSDDDKVIVWTKKDMPLGSRIVNWLGF